jgi:nucleotide-binding universal stress UspA family protein
MVLHKILVPLDGTHVSETALPTAVDLAKRYAASLVLLRVVATPPGPELGSADLQLASLRQAEGYLKQIGGQAAAQGVAAEASVWCGSPARAIVGAAEQHRADMIVMTTHVLTDLQRDMFGSVAERVLRGARMPVLVLHPEGVGVEALPGEAAPCRVSAA